MNTTYTLTFDQDSLKALNLPVFTIFPFWLKPRPLGW